MDNDYIDQWDINGTVYDIHAKDAGQPNGVAQLDANGRVPFSQLPESSVEYKGGWDANTNTPQLSAGVGTNGDMYVVTVAGQRDLGEGTKYFLPNDRVIYSGDVQVWQKFSSGDVKSVGGVTPTQSTGDVPVNGAISNVFSQNFAAKNRAVISDANGKLAESNVTSAELGTLSGIQSSVQTQLNGKQASVTGAATTILSADLTANRVLVSDANGKVAVSGVDATGISTVPTDHSSDQTTYGVGTEARYGHCKAKYPILNESTPIFDPASGTSSGTYVVPISTYPYEIHNLQYNNIAAVYPGDYTFNVNLQGSAYDLMKINIAKVEISYDGISWSEPAYSTDYVQKWLIYTPTNIPITFNNLITQNVRFARVTIVIERPGALGAVAFV